MNTKTIWTLPILLILSTLITACQSSDSSGSSGGFSLGSSMSDDEFAEAYCGIELQAQIRWSDTSRIQTWPSFIEVLEEELQQLKELSPPGKFKAVYDDSVSRHETMLNYANEQPKDERKLTGLYVPQTDLPTGVAPGYPGSPKSRRELSPEAYNILSSYRCNVSGPFGTD